MGWSQGSDLQLLAIVLFSCLWNSAPRVFQTCFDRTLICLIRSLIYYTNNLYPSQNVISYESMSIHDSVVLI